MSVLDTQHARLFIFQLDSAVVHFLRTSVTTTAPVSQTHPNRQPSNQSAPYFLTDFAGQSRQVLLFPPLLLRGGNMTLFGIYDLIWRAAGGWAVRGSLLVTLYPNCSFDSRSWDRQSRGEATHSSGEDSPARQPSAQSLPHRRPQRIFRLCVGWTKIARWRRFPKPRCGAQEQEEQGSPTPRDCASDWSQELAAPQQILRRTARDVVSIKSSLTFKRWNRSRENLNAVAYWTWDGPERSTERGNIAVCKPKFV